jgi:hypothetical protein
MTKSVHFKSVTPVLISAAEFLAAVNDMREEYGDGPASKAPVDLATAVQGHRVLVYSDDDFGQIGLDLEYENDGMRAVRRFPGTPHNDDASGSKLEVQGDFVAIHFDLRMTAGKSKRLKDDIAGIANIFRDGNYTVSLKLGLNTNFSSPNRVLTIEPGNKGFLSLRDGKTGLSPDAFSVTIE